MSRIVIQRRSSVFVIKAPRGTRSCSSCNGCCKTHQVTENAFFKPAGEWCRYCAIGKGCKIYEDRPENCRAFMCEWLKGSGEESERPDRVKVVLDYIKASDGLPNGILQIFELSEGGLFSNYGKQAAREALAANAVVTHLYLSGRRTVFLPLGQPSVFEMLEKAGDRDKFEFGNLKDLEA